MTPIKGSKDNDLGADEGPWCGAGAGARTRCAHEGAGSQRDLSLRGHGRQVTVRIWEGCWSVGDKAALLGLGFE